MAQTPALLYAEGEVVDYTPGSAVSAGDVVVLGTIPMIAPVAIAANVKGTLACAGVWKVPQKAEIITAGDAVYWDSTGNPVTGTAGTGAATAATPSVYLMGVAAETTAATDSYCKVILSNAKRVATIAGAVTASDISAEDASLAVAGLAAAQGGAIVVTGGTSSTAGNAGGAVTLVGGTPGVTGVGGAVGITGGAGGATSGTGGAASVVGGAGTAGNANGGAVAITSGANHGSGTAGAVAIDTGAHSAGTAGSITVGATSAGSITLGRTAGTIAVAGRPTFALEPRSTPTTVAASNSAQNNATAVLEGFTLVTAADGTKAVVLPSAVAGMQVRLKNNADNVLKVFPAASDAINAAAANAVFNVPNFCTVTLEAYDATTWYSFPLLPS